MITQIQIQTRLTLTSSRKLITQNTFKGKLWLDAEQSESFRCQIQSWGTIICQLPMKSSANMCSITTDVGDLNHSPDGLRTISNIQTWDLHASRRVKIQCGTLTLCKLPVAELDHNILFAMGFNVTTTIHGHDFITWNETWSLVKLDSVRLKVKSGTGIICQLPINRLGNVNIVSTNRFNASRTIGGENSGVRESSRNFPIQL